MYRVNAFGTYRFAPGFLICGVKQLPRELRDSLVEETRTPSRNIKAAIREVLKIPSDMIARQIFRSQTKNLRGRRVIEYHPLTRTALLALGRAVATRS